MVTKEPSLKSQIFRKDDSDRLEAFHKAVALPDSDALPALRRGLKHWDHKLRNMCARELVRRLGGKAASLLIPLRAQNLLHASCSTEILVQHEDPALIKYLKRVCKDSSAVGEIASNLILRTSYYAKVKEAEAKAATAKAARELAKNRRAAAKAEREAARKAKESAKTESSVGKSEELAAGSLAATSEKPSIEDSHWSNDTEMPFLSEIDPQCAVFIRRHWGLGRQMDDLYRVKEIPKKSGGMRQIEAPCASLKVVQRGILAHVLEGVRHNIACHGFRSGCSIATNAAPHVGKEVVLNLDLRDFFPSINAARVYGIYKSFIGEGAYARFLTDVSVFKGRLPQGAPTSPMIANLTCLRLDRRLGGLAKRIGADYTRYADDLTFSGPESILRYIPPIKAIITEEGFQVALPKLRIHRRGSRQDVTGLTVNQKVSVPRAIRRRLRAAVHTVSGGGVPTWKGEELTSQSLKGHIDFIASVHHDLGAKFLKQFSRRPKKKKK